MARLWSPGRGRVGAGGRDGTHWVVHIQVVIRLGRRRLRLALSIDQQASCEIRYGNTQMPADERAKRSLCVRPT